MAGFLLLAGCQTSPKAEGSTGVSTDQTIVEPSGFFKLGNAMGSLQFRLYTNAGPDAPRLFNTFELEACGQQLLAAPTREQVRRMPAEPASPAWHNILIDGRGPLLASANSARLIEQASGPEWRYAAFDLTSAYQDRLTRFTRRILFVEPDLFILFDQLTAPHPVDFRTLLHPAAITRLDTNWGELHLELPGAALVVNSPGRREDPRFWEEMKSEADPMLSGTKTMQLGPTNRVTSLNVVTVFAVNCGETKGKYAFKLLENSQALGARIHRNGLPTLIAFKIDPLATHASLTGFGFDGPVGVHVFRPKKKAGSP